MKEITNVTIVSTNLNKKIFSNYKDYIIIEKDFTYEELLKNKKVIFYNVLNNLSLEDLQKLFTYLKENNILFVNATNDIEMSLYTDYLLVYDEEKVLIEGTTLEVLKNEKLLKRLGIHLPFIVELSLLLKDYGLIDEIVLNKERLVDILWK